MKEFLTALLIVLPCSAKAQVSSFVNAPGGNVGIATTTPAALFTVGNGTLAVTSAGKVGIGVVTPGYALQNAGATFTQGQEIVGGTMTVQGNAFSVSGSALIVSAGNVGVGTTSPGSLFTVSANTFTVTSAGIVTAPSQPLVSVTDNSGQGIPTGAFTNVYWSATTILTQGMWAVTPDSSAITIPVSGNYDIAFHTTIGAPTGASQISSMITKNGSQLCAGLNFNYSGAGYTGVDTITTEAHCLKPLSAGDVIRYQMYHDSTVNNKILSGTSRDNYGSVVKVW